MLERIASNSYYDVLIDTAKNRIYLTIKGFWQTRDLVPHYIDDLSEAADLMRPAFTVVANLSRMVPPTDEVGALHKTVQKLMLERGMVRVAEIADDPGLIGVANGYAAETRINKRVFSSPRFAEVWLDSFEE